MIEIKGKYNTAKVFTDLAIPEILDQVVTEGIHQLGYLDGLVLNHAFSVWGSLGEWTAEHIDAHLNVNVRVSMLMIQAFQKQFKADSNRERGGVITLFTTKKNLT